MWTEITGQPEAAPIVVLREIPSENAMEAGDILVLRLREAEV